MSDKYEGVFNLTAPVVMSHPNLFEARAFGKKGKENGEPKYSANYVFDPDHPDLKPMKELAAKIAKARWPGREFNTLKFPFSAGTKLADKRKEKSGKDDGDFQRGKVVIAARSKYQPKLSGIENGKVVDYEGDAIIKNKGKFYFGVETLAQFNFQPYDGVGSNPDGITVYLNMVFTTNKGKKLSTGGQSASEVFKGYAGKATTEDPGAVDDGMGSMDDDISF